MGIRKSLPLGLLCLTLGTRLANAEDRVVGVSADPAAIRLSGPMASYSLLIHGRTVDGRLVDQTHIAQFESLQPEVATVSDAGVVRGVSDGIANVAVQVTGRKLTVPVTVEGCRRARRFNFEKDIIPILSRFGCNSSGCHGKAEGQNGFKLSVFGFDPKADLVAITQESRGRRVFTASPDQSLLLKKVSGVVAHGGGLRIPRKSSEYETLRDWIAAGVPFGEASDPKVVSVRLEPSERILAMRGMQQLRVIARYSDGREIDATAYAKFQSNNDGLVAVNANGLVTAGETPGDAAVMASFMNCVDIFRVIVPSFSRRSRLGACPPETGTEPD